MTSPPDDAADKRKGRPAATAADIAWAEDAYAPLVTEGPVLEALRAKLAGIALDLGHPPQVEQIVPVKGVGFHRALIGRHVTIVRLQSPTFYVSGDQRRLGVAVADLQIDGKVVPFKDLRLQRGFHDIEHSSNMRWTDGDAFLVLDPVPHERVLRLRIASAAPDEAED